MLDIYFSNKYGILYVGSRVYEITYNITKKGRVAARPFSYIVRRIGMTKPPVKLGVGKKFLEKRKEPPSGKM
ncbi:hypothetical protein, partial [Veillonella sp.]|uniref:hypothetical protein n=1 Tax=Veillonella sp. TaxID=1926307 RepID=UPI002908C4B7